MIASLTRKMGHVYHPFNSQIQSFDWWISVKGVDNLQIRYFEELETKTKSLSIMKNLYRKAMMVFASLQGDFTGTCNITYPF